MIPVLVRELTPPERDVVNDELLLDVYGQIVEHPDTWTQWTWRCGSGLCFAGWTVTLGGMDYLMPGRFGALIGNDLVVVPSDWPGAREAAWWISGDLKSNLKASGSPWLADFEQDKPIHIVGTCSAAIALLGLPLDVAKDLFFKDNTLADIRQMLTTILGASPDHLLARR